MKSSQYKKREIPEGFKFFTKEDKTGHKRGYLTANCDLCGLPHTLLKQAFMKTGHVMHKECFINWNNKGQHMRGVLRRTESTLLMRTYKSYQISALRRNLEWNITSEEFYIISKRNCTYCGIEPLQYHREEKLADNKKFLHNGLDRIDNNKGYTKDNITSCCKLCNFAKRDLKYDEWIAYLHRLTKYRQLSNV